MQLKKVRNLTSLAVWRKADLFYYHCMHDIDHLSKTMPDVSFCDRLRDNIRSISANIARGFRKRSGGEFEEFLLRSKDLARQCQESYDSLKEQRLLEEDKVNSRIIALSEITAMIDEMLYQLKQEDRGQVLS